MTEEYLEYEKHTTTVTEGPSPLYGGPSALYHTSHHYPSSSSLLGGSSRYSGGGYTGYTGGRLGTVSPPPRAISPRRSYGGLSGGGGAREWQSADGTAYHYDSPTLREYRYQSPDGRRSVYEAHEQHVNGDDYVYESREESGGGLGLGLLGSGLGSSSPVYPVTSSYERTTSPLLSSRRPDYMLPPSPSLTRPLSPSSYRRSTYQYDSSPSRFSGGGYSSEGFSAHGSPMLYRGGLGNDVVEEEYEELTHTRTVTTW